MNEHGCFPIKLYLWTLNFEYYTVFPSHEIFFDSFQPFKNGKAIFYLADHTKTGGGPDVAHRSWFADPYSKVRCSGPPGKARPK